MYQNSTVHADISTPYTLTCKSSDLQSKDTCYFDTMLLDMPATLVASDSGADVLLPRIANPRGATLVLVDSSLRKTGTTEDHFIASKVVTAEIVRALVGLDDVAIWRFEEKLASEPVVSFEAIGSRDFEIQTMEPFTGERAYILSSVADAITKLDREETPFRQIIVLSDGNDENASTLAFNRLVEAAKDTNIRVHTIATYADDTIASGQRGGILRELAPATGGAFEPIDLSASGGVEVSARAIAEGFAERAAARLTVQIERPEGMGEPITVRAINDAGVLLAEATLPAVDITTTADPVTTDASLDPADVQEEGAAVDITGFETPAGEEGVDNAALIEVADPPVAAPVDESRGAPSWFVTGLGALGIALLAAALLALRSRRSPQAPISNVSEPAEDRQPPPAKRLNGLLEIVGADRPPIEVRGDNFTIGRGTDNDFQTKNASTSRQHCAILRERDGRIVIHDFGSLNGVVVNGEQVEKSIELTDGALIELGEVRMKYWQGYASNKTNRAAKEKAS